MRNAAIETALLEMKRTDLPVRLYTDSSYACAPFVNGWKAKKNIDLVNRIRQRMARFSDLKIIKVKGHSGLDGNERADQLATSAIIHQNDSL
ncbi:MAG: RNase H family protein [Desulfobacterales bacterium]